MAYILFGHNYNHKYFSDMINYLHELRHETAHTGSESELVRMLKTRCPDVLVLALLLRDGTTEAILEQIRAQDEYQNIQVILLIAPNSVTGPPNLDWNDRAISNYIIIPCNQWQLFIAISQLLNRTVCMNIGIFDK